ncbi:MAG: hypothetical protein L6416_03585 [Candidatus Omnitrophica bacterium]|nr:hypothetical protein [Candidatus Omnitrophota bacterium]
MEHKILNIEMDYREKSSGIDSQKAALYPARPALCGAGISCPDAGAFRQRRGSNLR